MARAKTARRTRSYGRDAIWSGSRPASIARPDPRARAALRAPRSRRGRLGRRPPTRRESFLAPRRTPRHHSNDAVRQTRRHSAFSPPRQGKSELALPADKAIATFRPGINHDIGGYVGVVMRRRKP